ncbi:hypothetical protein P6709_15465 [Jeotgalibacillus sp. ET6]|uniref:hypothetical protein n=1 Tax=Jeotgalibacillus sp. ET6 TaxID=3037260 RepID=UPI0024181ED9|nr:hypothetical protein [Jeotgalibacillus sp. ET6]MDG5473151.1 hypothetical protein [Jeotgalibacillus sp. ET6]
MQILSYGEDAYTLWALKHQLSTILSKLEDSSSISECKVIYRPSFGRRGGENSAQFGEFDFIFLSKTHVYLGESKWDRSSEIKGDYLLLREEQERRHHIFTDYIKSWFKGEFASWDQFIEHIGNDIVGDSYKIRTAPAGSRLAENLNSLLTLVKDHFNHETPEIQNILLYLYNGSVLSKIPAKTNNKFQLIELDYNEGLIESSNYVDLA